MTDIGANGPVPGVDRSAVFDVLPAAFVVLTPDLIVADANEAYLAVTGRERAELIGTQFLTAFPPPTESLGPDGRSELQVSLERVRDTGLPDTLPVQKYPIADADGVLHERHWLAIHVPVLDADGRVVFLVQRTEDITEFSLERERVAALADSGGATAEVTNRAKRIEAELFVRARELADAVAAKDAAARQVAGLTEVSIALTSVQTLDELETVVCRGASVLGADGAAVLSVAQDGGWRLTTSAALGGQVQLIYGNLPYDSPLPGPHVARSGDRLLLPTRASARAFHPSMEAVYADIVRESWAFLPLEVDGRRHGALAVSWVHEHHLAQAEVDLFEGFAAQCAQALLRIETADVQRAAALEVQQLAGALQQALLTPPPTTDQLQIAVRYRPAGHHAQVGGDWYDAFTQPSGATMLVIGDVVGHDSVAAAKMGQLRGVLRTLAYDMADTADTDGTRGAEDGSLAAVLTRLEHVAQGLAVDTLATTILARIERADDEEQLSMRWANAGHLPPMVIYPDGQVEALDVKPDLLLGVDVAATRRDHVISLPPESTVLLYTDGLIERRDASLDEGIERFRGVLAGRASTDLEELCDAVLTEMASDDDEDDIALLVVRTNPR